MTTLPLTDHHVVLAAAEEMAREVDAEVNHDLTHVGDPPRHVVRAHARLICSLDRPASRDWWIRFLADRRLEQARASAPDLVRGPAFDGGARRTIADLLTPLRDDPDALAVAILAALSETPDAR